MKLSGKRGFSLIEVLTTLSVAAVAVTLAVPSYSEIRAKRQVTSSGEQIASFVENAQGLAVATNRPVTVNLVHQGETEWCLGASTGADPCDCTVSDPAAEAFCAVNGVPQVFGAEQGPQARMIGHAEDTAFTFESREGFMAAEDMVKRHHYQLAGNSGGFALRINVNPTGRVSVCNASEEAKVAGYSPCEPLPDSGGLEL